MSQLENLLCDQLLKAVTITEEQVDREIEKYQKIDDSDLKQLRKQRIDELKAKERQKKDWLSNGHGTYEELPDERSFFDASKKSEKFVCHFSLPTTERCKIVHMHLQKIAAKHIGTRFVYVNSEKFPFLAERLNIRVIPTLAVIMNSKTVDYLRGFDDLGAVDDFRTETLEWRLAQSGVIDYNGSSYLPGAKKTKKFVLTKKKAIRGKTDDDDDDDLDDY